MKKSIQIFIFICFTGLMYAQPTGFNIDNVTHVSFRYDDGSIFEQESSHYQPGILSFWTDNTYSRGSNRSSTFMNIFDPDQVVEMNLESLIFSKMQGGPFFIERVQLDYDGLYFVNGASWRSLNAYIRGNGGQLDLFTGVNGNYIVRLGSTAQNSARGNLVLYGPNGNAGISDAVSSTNFGYSWYYGINGTSNVYIGPSSADHSDGRIIIYDNGGNQQAGIYVNAANQGVVWGDTKSFRMKHPYKSNTEIWYASIEGPEAAAYERGTADLVDGEAFIEFSEHYRIVANPKTMTVILTPMEWDTYGLAVVEKTDHGFRVKELKGGTGDFSFDWEVKCVRKGKEKFKVIRSTNENLAAEPEQVVADKSKFSEKIIGKKAVDPNQKHAHSEACVHFKKGMKKK